MTGLTDQWLRMEFQDHARTIDPPADLHQESMRRARATRKRRKGLQAAFTVGMAAVVTGVIVIVTGALSPSSTPAPADPAPATRTFDLYFVDMGRINSTQQPTLVSEPVTVPNTGDKPLDIVNALMGSVAEGQGTNGFNFSSDGQNPVAEVNAVTVGPDVITVDLDRDVWDPYPLIRCRCPSGDIVMQQLVWTLDSALNSTLPVLLTINGEPARGIWLQQLDGPVSLKTVPVERSSVSTTLECENNLRSSGEPDYGLPGEPNTEEPLDQAARFVDGTGTRRDYPDVESVLAEQQPTAQIIALVSDDKSVGILRYENDDTLGWHLTSTEQCSPKR